MELSFSYSLSNDYKTKFSIIKENKFSKSGFDKITSNSVTLE